MNIQSPLFKDRRDAGAQLARKLLTIPLVDPVLYALPRGGVVVASEVADKLDIPVEVLISRKLGFPSYPEFGMGAISEDEVPYLDEGIIRRYQVLDQEVKKVIQKEISELKRRKEKYRNNLSLSRRGTTALVIDDGVATGVTAIAAGRFLKHTLHYPKVILAIPVGPKKLRKEIIAEFDEVIALHLIDPFYGVGIWYENFKQVEDEEVLEILNFNNKKNFQDHHSIGH